jgi:hypothetical protein
VRTTVNTNEFPNKSIHRIGPSSGFSLIRVFGCTIKKLVLQQRCTRRHQGKESMDISIIQASIENAAEILALQKLACQSEAKLNGDRTIPPLTQTIPEIEAACIYGETTMRSAQKCAHAVNTAPALDTRVPACRRRRLASHSAC